MFALQQMTREYKKLFHKKEGKFIQLKGEEMDMVYRSEDEKGLSNPFLLGTASQGCWAQQSEQLLFQRLHWGWYEYAEVHLG